jgi:hypothetical protein
MARRPAEGLDDWTKQLIKNTLALISLGVDGVTSKPELARRLGITSNNLGNYMRPGSRGYGPWTFLFANKVAGAFGLSLDQFLHHHLARELGHDSAKRNGDYAWQPDSDSGSNAVERFGQHEQMARERIGMYRIPPCVLMPLETSRMIRRNCFAPYGDAGKRAAEPYEQIENHYRQEYERREGHYGGCNVISLILKSDMQRLIKSQDEFTGCWRTVQGFLEQLRNHHVRELKHQIGFIDDEKVPGNVRRDLAGADSVILVGSTLGVRRGRQDFQLRFADQGSELIRDQSSVRTLLKYANLGKLATLHTIEAYMRQADQAVKVAHAKERAVSY